MTDNKQIFKTLVRLSKTPVLLLDSSGKVISSGNLNNDPIISKEGYFAVDDMALLKNNLSLSAKNLNLLSFVVTINNEKYKIEAARFNPDENDPLILAYIYHTEEMVRGFHKLNQFSDLSYEVKKHKALEQKLLQQTKELRESRDRIKELINYDYLTGLMSRRLFFILFDRAILRANRSKDKIAVLYCDIDGFKQVNDKFGHYIGDLLLREISCSLQGAVREVDAVSRFGGDEFVIFLENISDIKDVLSIVEKMESVFSKPIVVEGNQTNTKISIGISMYPTDSLNSDDLINLADKALYEAKKTVGNSHCFYESLGSAKK